MTNYNYDSLGNLVAVYMPGKNVQYHIDARNRRTVKLVNGNLMSRFVWQSQLQLIAELDQNKNVKARFVYAEGVNSPDYMVKDGRKFMFIKDQRGSVNLVVDSETGEVKQKIRYSDWGEVLEDTNPGFQPFGFAGGLYDSDTGLVRFGARDYDAVIGRWYSKDPILFNGADSNLYSYCFNDPINLYDPTGNLSEYFYSFGNWVMGKVNAAYSAALGVANVARGVSGYGLKYGGRYSAYAVGYLADGVFNAIEQYNDVTSNLKSNYSDQWYSYMNNLGNTEIEKGFSEAKRYFRESENFYKYGYNKGCQLNRGK